MHAIRVDIKSNIKKLIEMGNVASAKQVLASYSINNDFDGEIYALSGMIESLEGNDEVAIINFQNALNYNPSDVDSLYNLGYLYVRNNQKQKAYLCYKKLLEMTDDQQLKDEVINNVKVLESENEDLKKMNITKRISFFVKTGMDTFLNEIIDYCSQFYVVNKITITELKQIDEHLMDCDIAWFEWCDELVIYASQLESIYNCKIICRLHSYEAFTNNIKQVRWDRVDQTIFVANHIKNYVEENSSIIQTRCVVIPNSVNIEKWQYKKRKHGNKVAYVGYINYKKGPQLLLQSIFAMVKVNPKVEIHVAGDFQDARDVLYFNQMIKEKNLQKNFYFHGWIEDLDTWLEDKNYLICTSILESQNMSIMQGMAKGIKPLIHNFVGADSIYPKSLLWTTLDDLVELKETDYISDEYRNYIKENYSTNYINNKYTSLIDNIEFYCDNKPKSTKVEFSYSGKIVKFILPELSDWIQKIIFTTRNFYEVEMLEDIKNRVGRDKTIVDIGANIGNHSVFLAKICDAKMVYSFEPQPKVFKMLSDNIKLNKLDNVVLYNMGAGSVKNKADLGNIDNFNLGMTKLTLSEEGSIDINTLDNVLIGKTNKIDLIKIDVEGMEIEVLKGATEVIKRDHPILYVEAATQVEYQLINEFLSDYGYKPTKVFNATPTYLFEYKLESRFIE